MLDLSKKITASHLSRNAYLYIRQSSLKQVLDNQESTKRQYALQDRALTLGWAREQLIIIDLDQGHSGAEAADRKGFQRLVAEVGLGQAGIVMGLEVSRLARNSADWHRLIELCAMTNTLILDEDGVYDPAQFNDRLLLGLKGTMSEAELHVLRARLRGGILNKARRGELKLGLPIGFVYNDQDKVVFDPNKQVQDSMHLFFKTFQRTGSTYYTVKWFMEKKLKFPRRPFTGPSKGDTIWTNLSHSQALRLLHNPRYAGVFYYGRTMQRRLPDGSYTTTKRPRDQWQVFLPNSHAQYITQEQFELNQKTLLENAQAHGHEPRKSPPREGPALLQGIVLCGICGRRMTLRYHSRNGILYPDYVCQNIGIESSTRICQYINGSNIDLKIAETLIQMMTPVTLEVALAVQQELEGRLKEAEKLRKKRVNQAQYEAELASRRYKSVDPDNRLVADSLEADWNEKLRELIEAQKEFEEESKRDRMILNQKQRDEIFTLATDFPRLWKDPKTPDRERKRMVRLLIEDVTLTKAQGVLVQIRFKAD